VSRHFRRLCNTLDEHKKALAIFPTQSTYASVVCGSLTLIVSAAVNHDAIAETISQTVADITVKATRVTKVLNIITTQAMREVFSELYAQVFLFYRNAIEWYMKSKTSRFFGSFNEKLIEEYHNADKRIDNCIREMYREANIAGLAILRVVDSTTAELRHETIRQRQQSSMDYDLNMAGWQMAEMLKAMHQHHAFEEFIRSYSKPLPALALNADGDSIREGVLNRSEAREISINLENFIIGDEGHRMFGDGKFWLPDIEASSALEDWMSDKTQSSTLWISSEDVSTEMPSSRAAALSAIIAAWHAEMPIISHFCERPRYTDVSRGRDVEKMGLLGLLYSLITQLLQFNVEDDRFEIAQKQVNALDGSDDSWSPALELFSKLLKATPYLSICVLDGLNDLCFSAGAEWCKDLLNVLFDYRKSSPVPFRVLLTTSGQSRVLPEYVRAEDRLSIVNSARAIARSGKWVTASR